VPELRQDHDSAESSGISFGKHDSHFKPRMTFRFSGVLSPGKRSFQGRESAQVTRIGADHLACRSILAVVPPCAGEYRLVRVTGVLIFVNDRTCVAFVLLPSSPLTIAAAPVSGPGGPARGALANCRYYSSARPPSSRFRCHAGNNVP
jgi:hypothetical protein